jgi:type VI protein secretion system component VasK
MFNSLDEIQIIMAAVAAAGLVAAGIWAALRGIGRRQAAAAGRNAAIPAGAGLPPFLRHTARQLRLAKARGAVDAASLRDLPVVLLVGPRGSGKTSVVAQSLNPGQPAAPAAGADGHVPEAWKVWLAEGTVFLEVPESAAADPQALRLLGRGLRPGFRALMGRDTHPPRSILFCAPLALFGQQPEAQVAEAARTWNARLRALAEALGADPAVYVLVTRLDGLEGFGEFTAALADDEAGEPLGATLPVFEPAGPREYADWIGKAVPESFAGIVRALRDSRIAVMSRERDPARLARQFEFPKRFERMQYNLGVLLRELTQPGRGRGGPFLRGYYFCGTRPWSEQDPAPAGGEAAVTATTVLDPGKPAPGAAGTVTEWLFLPALLRDVLLADRPAREAGGSRHADPARALAAGAAGAVALLLILAFTASYVRNRGLERALAAGAAIVQGNSPADPLARLEAMRPAIDRLARYHDAGMSGFGWGLGQTRKLIPPAQTIYCTAAREQVVDPLRRRIEARLGSPAAGNPSEDYRLLKAYMMMTTRPEKADAGFLAAVLLDASGPGGHSGRLLGDQLRTYGRLLAIPDARHACVFAPSAGLIESVQGRLRGWNGNDRYQSLLELAGRGLEPVSYDARFPNDAVRDPHVVPAWFTRPGWDRVQDLLRNPGQSLRSDAWVLGGRDEIEPAGWKALAERYQSDYIREWKEFLAAAQVSPYASLKDAAAKIERMSGRQSALLRLIGLASEHGAFDPVRPAFQPALSVVAANGSFQAAKYLDQLDALKNRLLKASESTGAAHEQDSREVRDAATAVQDAVDQAARGFQGDSDQLVKALLLRPIVPIGGLLAHQDAQALNAAGKDLCREAEAVTRALPFAHSAQSASFDAVAGLLQPPAGRLWKLYYETLQDSLICADTGCFVKDAPRYPLSKAFERYFTALHQWSRLLFGAGGDPIVRLRFEALKYNSLQRVDVTVDGSTAPLAAGSLQPAAISWDLRRAGRLRVAGTFEGANAPQTLFQGDGRWAIFEWLAGGESNGGSGGLLWTPRGAAGPALLDNRRTIEYKLLVQWADGSGRALDLRAIAPGACVLPILR